MNTGIPASAHFESLDWIVLIGYLVAVLIVGSLWTRRQSTTREYFLAGKRMSWWPVGISVVASITSGISFIGHPSRVYQYDSALMARIFSVILITPVIMYILLPVYRRMDVTTAYEYLEKRFGLNVRLLASALFIGKRLLWMALVTLAPSLVLSTVTGLRVEYCILIMGLGATIYTALGGMSAVIWTDVTQFFVLTVGQIAIIAYVAFHLEGGFGEILQVGIADQKAWASLDFNLAELTFWTMLIAGLGLALSDMGADQVTVQRLMATKDERAARRSLIFNAIVRIPGVIILLGMGVALWVFYKAHPEAMGLAAHEADKIVPYFVVTQLPVGISGFVIAAIFAAAMSSFDSGLNSLVTAFTIDWYKRLFDPGRSDRRYLLLAKSLTLVLGLAITMVSILIYQIGIVSIIDASNKYLGFFGGPLLGLFLLGTLTRRTRALPAVVGAVSSVAGTLLLDQWQSGGLGFLLHPYLYSTLSCLSTILIGYLGSLLRRKSKVPQEMTQLAAAGKE